MVNFNLNILYIHLNSKELFFMNRKFRNIALSAIFSSFLINVPTNAIEIPGYALAVQSASEIFGDGKDYKHYFTTQLRDHFDEIQDIIPDDTNKEIIILKNITGDTICKISVEKKEEEKEKEKNQIDDNIKCPICLEQIKHNDCALVTNCGHCYHRNCIGEWLKKSPKCPVCNGKILDELVPKPAYLLVPRKEAESARRYTGVAQLQVQNHINDNQFNFNMNQPLGFNMNQPLGLNMNQPLGLNMNQPLGFNMNQPLGFNMNQPFGFNMNWPLGFNMNQLFNINIPQQNQLVNRQRNILEPRALSHPKYANPSYSFFLKIPDILKYLRTIEIPSLLSAIAHYCVRNKLILPQLRNAQGISPNYLNNLPNGGHALCISCSVCGGPTNGDTWDGEPNPIYIITSCHHAVHPRCLKDFLLPSDRNVGDKTTLRCPVCNQTLAKKAYLVLPPRAVGFFQNYLGMAQKGVPTP